MSPLGAQQLWFVVVNETQVATCDRPARFLQVRTLAFASGQCGDLVLVAMWMVVRGSDRFDEVEFVVSRCESG